MVAASRELELLVAKIQKQLAPESEVLHDVKLPGRESGTRRQIDVLVRDRIGQYEINIIIDCKDYAKPVDVKGVEEFNGLVQDVGANRGVLVCPKGFTSAAKTRADRLQIDLYSPIDTDKHKWQARVAMPVFCDFRSVAISFGISFSAPLPFLLSPDFFHSTIVYKADGTDLGNTFKATVAKWNKGNFSRSVGEHDSLVVFDDTETFVDNGYGMKVPVEITASLSVSRELYYGKFPILRLSGFKDEIRDQIITNAFEIGLLDPNEVMQNWRRIEAETEVEPRPFLTLVGSIMWET